MCVSRLRRSEVIRHGNPALVDWANLCRALRRWLVEGRSEQSGAAEGAHRTGTAAHRHDRVGVDAKGALRGSHGWSVATAVAGFLVLAGATPAFAGNVRLGTDTASAFARYVRLTDARNEAELKRGTRLLWIDGLPEAERATAYERLQRGDIEVQKLETVDGGVAIACPGGLIHHWTGVVFIPGVSVDDVLAVLQDYDRQAVYYAPDVERSKVISRDGEHFRVYLRFRRHKVITVVLDTEHEVNYFHDATGLAHSRSSAVRIAEVEDAGSASERLKEPGDDDGFLWKMETWWRVEQADGGVYVQSEVASLTRGIPAGLGWLLGPFVTSIPRETLGFTLEATRKAVVRRRAK
jgi:hypothetical protein